MIRPPLPPDEDRRLAALRRLALLDTEADESFARITRIARRLFEVPVAFVSLLDEDRQWFKSRVGADSEGTDRDISFSAHAVAADELLVVVDARVDERFHDNPLVSSGSVVFYAARPIRSPEGLPVGVFCVVDSTSRKFSDEDAATLEDLAAVVEREIEMHYRACLDEVTGVYNRRGFVAIGRSVLEGAARRGTSVAVAYLDVDGLKGVNDEHGHGVGDHALVAVAHALRAGTRASDVVGRLGGDEFGLLLCDCSKQACDAILGDLQQRFATELAAVAPGLHVGLSAGAAGADEGAGTGLDELIRLADAEMYARKVAKQRA